MIGNYQLVGQDISISKIYQAIKDCQEGIHCINLPKSGQLKGRRLIERAKNEVGTTMRKLSRINHILCSTVSRTNARNNLNCRKIRKALKYTAVQWGRIPRCCRALRRIYFRGEAINADIYVQNCLAKLQNFVNTHHYNDQIMFWSARRTRDWLAINGINFVPKIDNPLQMIIRRNSLSNFGYHLSRINDGSESQNEKSTMLPSKDRWAM